MTNLSNQALAKRIEYILDPTASAKERLVRRSHLTNHDLRAILTALGAPTADRGAVLEEAAAYIEALVRLASAQFASVQSDLPIKAPVFSCLGLQHIATAIRALKAPPVSSVEGDEPVCAQCKGVIGDLPAGRDPEELCDTCYEDAVANLKTTPPDTSGEDRALTTKPEPEGEIGELVEHLSGPHEWGYRDLAEGGFIEDHAPFDVADTVSNLQAKVSRLEAALTPFAKASYAYTKPETIVQETPSAEHPNYYLAARDLFAARAALKPTSKYGQGSAGNEMGGE